MRWRADYFAWTVFAAALAALVFLILLTGWTIK